MSKRKVFLIEAIAVMAVLCILSLFSVGRTKSSVIKTDAKIERLLINFEKGEIELKKDKEKWFLGDYEASAYDVKRMLKELSAINVLNKIDNMKGEDKKEKYGFLEGNLISVEAFAGEKSVRKLFIGKLSSTYSQTFIALKDDGDVYLAAGNLRDVFALDAETLKDKKVYSLNRNDITSVSVSVSGKTWGAKKDGDKWIGVPEGGESEKIEEYVSSVSSLYASKWQENKVDLRDKEDMALVIQTKDEVIKLKFYAYEDGFIAKRSDSNHEAFIKKEVAEKFFAVP